MARPDPIELGVKQFQRDRERKVPIPGLAERKIARVAVSPLGFLRGSAPLFYELLGEHPELWEGPRDAGNLCGDAHVENFGVYRTSRKKASGGVPDATALVFDVNDFDETIVGPWRLDVLRLLASLILAGREFGAEGNQIVSQCRALMGAYAGAAFAASSFPRAPTPVARLLEKVERRSIPDMLDRRTTVIGKERRFIIGDRYMALPKDLAAKARDAFHGYVQKTASEDLPADHCDIVDMAFRIAGTGSLGTLRIAVLTRGKGGVDGSWLFDMKEEGPAAAKDLLGVSGSDGAKRVFDGARACLEYPPRNMGTTELDGTSMLVRRLAPQEDKLDLTKIEKADLQGLASFLGALLGRAHRRGAVNAGSTPWSAAEQDSLVDRAITIAGVHEASYLAYCKAVMSGP